jgi:uncharacterized membrane protein YfcA
MSGLDEVVVFLAFAAFAAGFVDAVVGGGGLVQLPALFGSLPQATPASLFGTNKVSSIAGTVFAARRYMRSVPLFSHVLWPAVVAAGLFSWLGAGAVSLLPRAWAQPLVLVLLVVVAAVTLRQRSLGLVHKPRLSVRQEVWFALGLGAVLGFYDGFFGPGTGAFLIFIFVRVFGYDFLHASAHSKLINLMTNFGALVFFVPTGEVLWKVALVMASCNVVGSVVGARTAVRRGSQFVRLFFIGLLAVMIVRMGLTTFEMFYKF